LTADRGTLAGEYFYFGREHQPIALKGTLGSDKALRLEESLQGGRITGRWALEVSGSQLTGTFTSTANGRQWKVQLTRAEQASSYFDGPPRTLETGLGPLTFRTARVPQSRHRVPQITSFKDPRTTAEVNGSLMASANRAHCEDRNDSSFDFAADSPLVVGDVLSVPISLGWFCGAAYPTSGVDDSLVYDLRDRRIVTFEDLFREDVSKDQLVRVLFPYELSRNATGATAIPPNDDQADCLEHWSLEALRDEHLERGFHLTAEGVVVRLELPHVIAVCANRVTVPYAATASIAKPGGMLARLAAAHAGKPLRYRIHRDFEPPEADIFFTPSPK
jgi:hypothetical protein